ncbi:MAG: hypothetical protein ACYTBJ_02250 [Planctomycetota bacterium]
MGETVHLVSPHGGSYCGLDAHEIYTVKGPELVGMKRLPEVNCAECAIGLALHGKARASHWHRARVAACLRRDELLEEVGE